MEKIIQEKCNEKSLCVCVAFSLNTSSEIFTAAGELVGKPTSPVRPEAFKGNKPVLLAPDKKTKKQTIQK